VVSKIVEARARAFKQLEQAQKNLRDNDKRIALFQRRVANLNKQIRKLELAGDGLVSRIVGATSALESLRLEEMGDGPPDEE
jgi:septal ring factor EnvC (AmiA/AmiB activator)